MAITIEEEKKPVNWIGIIGAIVIVASIFIGGYYLFFKKPELIEVVVPSNLQDLNKIAQVKFNPQEVVDSVVFKALRDYSQPLQLPPKGRPNPFKPF